MMKLIVVTLVVVAVVDAATNTCLMRRGKKMRTFGNTKERIKFPCKYNAIRDTVCGDWKVTVTPGNAIETDKYKRYIISTMWVGVENVNTGMKWEGRSSLKIARKYLNEDGQEFPFKTKDGALKFEEVFDHGDINGADDEVWIKEKNGQFKITYGLYETGGTWHRRSGWQFDCYSDTFEPSSYPDQICGDGTKKEVASYKRSQGWKDNRMAVVFFNVFNNSGVVQTHTDCKTTARTIQEKCPEGLKYEAARICWALVGKKHYNRCIRKNLETPESAMRHCTEFVCSEYKDPNSCYALSEEIDGCRELEAPRDDPNDESLSDKVKNLCAENLSIKRGRTHFPVNTSSAP